MNGINITPFEGAQNRLNEHGEGNEMSGKETWEQLLAKARENGPWHTAAPERRSHVDRHDENVVADPRSAELDKTMDADIAAMFAQSHKDKLRYVPELKSWVFWDEDKARWVQDSAGEVSAMHRLKIWMWSIAVVKAQQAYQAAISNGSSTDEAKQASRSIETTLKGTKKLRDVWGQVRTEPCLITSLKHFDADPWILNTPAGPIDLWEGSDLDLSPEHLCLKQTTVAPEDGPAPLWEKVLSDAFPDDPDTQEYLETSLALALVGDQSVQHFWMLSGEAGSGKGTIMNTVIQLLGYGDTGYAMPVEAEFLMHQKSDKHGEQFARLKGKRLVVSSESDRRQAFDAARVKNLTGNDVQSGRFMRGNTFSFKPTWKLFLMTNYRPTVDPEDTGFWRRFREIPFRHKPLEPIVGLQDRLIEEEGPQILARLIRKLMKFQSDGGNWAPESVQHATLENRAEQDTVIEFLQTMCELVDDQEVYTAAATLHEEFVKWAKLNDYETLNIKMFGRRITKAGLVPGKKTVNGKSIAVRRGVRLVHGEPWSIRD